MRKILFCKTLMRRLRPCSWNLSENEPLKNESWKGFDWYFPKDAHRKSMGRGSVRSDLKKLDLFTLETSKNHLIRNFLRNGRVRVNEYYRTLENIAKRGITVISLSSVSEKLLIIQIKH